MNTCSTTYAAKPDIDEVNDCSVRALAVASGMSYMAAHELFRLHGRMNRTGTKVSTSRRVHETHLGYTPIQTWRQWGNPTLSYFASTHPRGRFILHTRSHAFALIDGVIHDWSNGAGSRARIVRAWEVK